MEVDSEAPDTLPLKAALLVYATYNTVAITRHPVDDNGAIQPGEPIDVAGVLAMLNDKRAASGSQVLTKTFNWHTVKILADNSDWVVWWTPPGVRSVFVAGKPRKAWLPSLVWAGHRRHGQQGGLFLFACSGSSCPTPDSIVYRPRFGPDDSMNHIFNDCAVCMGTMNPKALTPEGWMESFFDTNFKTAGGLPAKKYAPQKVFQKFGVLKSAIDALAARSSSAH